MDVPSPIAGKVAEVVTKVGDKVSMGVLIARIEAGAMRPRPRRPPAPAWAAPAAKRRRPRSRRRAAGPPARPPAAASRRPAPRPRLPPLRAGEAGFLRRLRRARGAAPGARTRYRSERDQGHRRARPHHPRGREGGALGRRPASVAAAGGGALPAVPAVDFAKFGPIETVPLSRIKRISGPRLHASWVNVPARHPHRRSRHHRSRGLPQDRSTTTPRRTKQSPTASRCCRC